MTSVNTIATLFEAFFNIFFADTHTYTHAHTHTHTHAHTHTHTHEGIALPLLRMRAGVTTRARRRQGTTKNTIYKSSKCKREDPLKFANIH